MILGMTDSEFNRLTDLVGIPLAVAALLLALAIDLRRERGVPAGRAHVAVTVLLGLAALGVMVVRFARLAY